MQRTMRVVGRSGLNTLNPAGQTPTCRELRAHLCLFFRMSPRHPAQLAALPDIDSRLEGVVIGAEPVKVRPVIDATAAKTANVVRLPAGTSPPRLARRRAGVRSSERCNLLSISLYRLTKGQGGEKQ